MLAQRNEVNVRLGRLLASVALISRARDRLTDRFTRSGESLVSARAISPVWFGGCR
jgi:hypothetical protein